MYAKKYDYHQIMRNYYVNVITIINILDALCKGYHIKYIDPNNPPLRFIIYDDEFGQLTPEAQELYLELQED